MDKPPMRRFTKEEFEGLVARGFFPPEEELELIDGIIYKRTPEDNTADREEAELESEAS